MLGVLWGIVSKGLFFSPRCGQWKTLGVRQTWACILVLLLPDQLCDPGSQISGLSRSSSVKMRVNVKINYLAL